jgi:hypothetical protein
MLNVSKRSVKRARVVRDCASPELVELVEQGKVAVSLAAFVARHAPAGRRAGQARQAGEDGASRRAEEAAATVISRLMERLTIPQTGSAVQKGTMGICAGLGPCPSHDPHECHWRSASITFGAEAWFDLDPVIGLGSHPAVSQDGETSESAPFSASAPVHLIVAPRPVAAGASDAATRLARLPIENLDGRRRIRRQALHTTRNGRVRHQDRQG